MKRIILYAVALAAVFGISGVAYAADWDHRYPLDEAGASTTVALSTSAATLVPAASSLQKRVGLNIINLDSNNADVRCTLDTSTPTEAITTFDILIPDGSDAWIPAGNNLKVYCISLHTATESISVKEYR